MPMPEARITASTELIHSINHSAVLDAIRDQGPLSRARIAKIAGVSLSTVMRIVEDLIEKGLVVPMGKGASTGGRPGSLVDFNTSGLAVISIDLGGTKIYGAATDLGGSIQHDLRIPSQGSDHYGSTTLERLIAVIDELVTAAQPSGRRLLGIGVGAPGITNDRQGIILMSPSLGWKDMPLKQILHERFDLPVFVENDVNLAALGEYGYGAGKGYKNIALIALGTGIGGGIVIGGALYRGSGQAAGEIGYMVPGREFLGVEYSSFGALEQVASGTGIMRRALEQLDGKAPEGNSFTAKDVFEAARCGKEWAIRLVNDMVDYLTVCIANVVSVLDPDAVILSGGLMESADLILEPVRRKLDRLIPMRPELLHSKLGPRAIVLGATLYVLTATTGSHAVRRLP